MTGNSQTYQKTTRKLRRPHLKSNPPETVPTTNPVVCGGVRFSVEDNKCNECCCSGGLNEMCLTGRSHCTHAAQTSTADQGAAAPSRSPGMTKPPICRTPSTPQPSSPLLSMDDPCSQQGSAAQKEPPPPPPSPCTPGPRSGAAA